MSAHRRLEAFRREKRLSYRGLAQQLGVHFSHCQRICAGTRRPGLDLSARISAVTKSWKLGPIEPSEWAKGGGS